MTGIEFPRRKSRPNRGRKRGCPTRQSGLRKHPFTVDGDAFENDVALIVKHSLESHPVSDEVGTVYPAAQKLQTCSTKVISAAKEKQARETRELCVAELVDRVARENREPAMQEWRKEPFATANSKNTSRPVKSRQTKLKRDCQHSKSVRRRLRLETNDVARWVLRLHVMRVYASRASGRADDRRTRWRYLVGVWLEAYRTFVFPPGTVYAGVQDSGTAPSGGECAISRQDIRGEHFKVHSSHRSVSKRRSFVLKSCRGIL